MSKKILTIDNLKEIVAESIQRVLNELVYADANKVDRSKKTIGLTYTTNSRGEGNALASDKLVTDKMDTANGDTYEVMLKGNIPSYNITDIKGTEVMHYFKRLFDHQKTMAMVSNKSNNLEKDEYELQMKQEELDKFMRTFKKKIEFVLKYWVTKNKLQDDNFRAISIYPVPSSSNFNKEMAIRLSDIEVFGLPVQVIDQALMVKDLRNLEKDNDFIEKNKEFYNSLASVKNNDKYPGTVSQRIDDVLNMQNAIKVVDEIVPKLNDSVDKMLLIYYDYNRKGSLPIARLEALANLYKEYCDNLARVDSIKYERPSINKSVGIHRESAINFISYTKAPSVDKRSKAIWGLVKSFFRGEKSPINGERYVCQPIGQWKKTPFQIKNLSNSQRMGLRNIYNVNNEDQEMVQRELEKIKGTIFVIFDDNISGGATLGDICYQCKQLGIEHIVPITFGKMAQKDRLRGIELTLPKNNKGKTGFNF